MIYIIRIFSLPLSCSHMLLSSCLCFCGRRSSKKRKFSCFGGNLLCMWEASTEHCKILKLVDGTKGEAHSFNSLCKAQTLEYFPVFFSCLRHQIWEVKRVLIKRTPTESTFKEIFLARLISSIVNFTRKSEMCVTCSCA